MLTKHLCIAQVPHLILFLLIHIKTKEYPEIKELIENENIELFQKERNELRQHAVEAIAGIQEENKKYYKKKKIPNKYK